MCRNINGRVWGNFFSIVLAPIYNGSSVELKCSTAAVAVHSPLVRVLFEILFLFVFGL